MLQEHNVLTIGSHCFPAGGRQLRITPSINAWGEQIFPIHYVALREVGLILPNIQ